MFECKHPHVFAHGYESIAIWNMFYGSMNSCEKSFPFAKKENQTPIEIDRSMKWFLEFHSIYSLIFPSMQIRWTWYRLANDWPNSKFTFLGCEMPIFNWLKKNAFHSSVWVLAWIRMNHHGRWVEKLPGNLSRFVMYRCKVGKAHETSLLILFIVYVITRSFSGNWIKTRPKACKPYELDMTSYHRFFSNIRWLNWFGRINKVDFQIGFTCIDLIPI